MATTVGPDMMVETPTTETFDHANGHHLIVPGAMDGLSPRMTSLPSPQASPRSSVPLPNPPFVFPARPASSSASSSFSRATGQRPQSAIEISELADESSGHKDTRPPGSPALPEFSFNPGASLALVPAPETAFLSPPQSPSSPLTISARPGGHGHRRGGSEFVGGSIRSGDTITVMSTSPTKSESGMASPTLAPITSAQRRGHAHRRSAAISSHDLSSIILPPSNLRGSSAPSSPAVFDLKHKYSLPEEFDKAPQPEPSPKPSPEAHSTVAHEQVEIPVVQLQQPPKPVNRNRVGFSDTLEFIPRPLSLVSSDTSSTVTARPGHSVSGSISSIVSTVTERETTSPLGSSPTRPGLERRPSTAGAILERTMSVQEQESASLSPRRRGSIPYMGALPSSKPASPSTDSPTKTPKKWSFFGRETAPPASLPNRARPASVSSTESQSNAEPSSSSSTEHVPDFGIKDSKPDVAEQKPCGTKKTKKQKKVKSWAGSILSRKPKGRHGKQKRRAPTPPPQKTQDDGEDEMGNDMAWDPEPVMPTVMVTETSTNGDVESWEPPRPVTVPDEDSSYPMIDLDAALGPFNTPLPRNPEWEAAQRAGGFVKKQLHSAAGMSRFTGPGMHYSHRRAESAPEMAPFEAAQCGIHRFGSSSTMADVFEEEEEEDQEDSSKQATTGQSTPVAETPVSDKPANTSIISEMDAGNVELLVNESQENLSSASGSWVGGIKRKGSDLSDDDKSQISARVKSENTASSLHDEVIMEKAGDVDMKIVSGDESPSAAPSPRHVFKGKDLTSVDLAPLHLPTPSLPPVSPYSMTQSSAFPSPRSPFSYDAHRMSTAPSSVITEDNFQSLLMGEPGPEVRLSVDIPSLTSSNSTMTRESAFGHNPQARPPGPLHDQPRPASFSATAFGRRRSSLASLSRLISSSHGERSKLSLEVPMHSTDASEPSKREKISKTKRLSRMMQFWKSKDNHAPA